MHTYGPTKVACDYCGVEAVYDESIRQEIMSKWFSITPFSVDDYKDFDCCPRCISELEAKRKKRETA